MLSRARRAWARLIYPDEATIDLPLLGRLSALTDELEEVIKRLEGPSRADNGEARTRPEGGTAQHGRT
jgi:hypothetical protein